MIESLTRRWHSIWGPTQGGLVTAAPGVPTYLVTGHDMACTDPHPVGALNLPPISQTLLVTRRLSCAVQCKKARRYPPSSLLLCCVAHVATFEVYNSAHTRLMNPSRETRGTGPSVGIATGSTVPRST